MAEIARAALARVGGVGDGDDGLGAPDSRSPGLCGCSPPARQRLSAPAAADVSEGGGGGGGHAPRPIGPCFGGAVPARAWAPHGSDGVLLATRRRQVRAGHLGVHTRSRARRPTRASPGREDSRESPPSKWASALADAGHRKSICRRRWIAVQRADGSRRAGAQVPCGMQSVLPTARCRVAQRAALQQVDTAHLCGAIWRWPLSSRAWKYRIAPRGHQGQDALAREAPARGSGHRGLGRELRAQVLEGPRVVLCVARALAAAPLLAASRHHRSRHERSTSSEKPCRARPRPVEARPVRSRQEAAAAHRAWPTAAQLLAEAERELGRACGWCRSMRTQADGWC